MSENTNYNIGKRIRKLRLEYGLSQEQLALKANITTTYLGLLERNQKNPTIRIIGRICDSLNLSFSDFFSDQSISSIHDVDSIGLQILTQLQGRTDEEKKILLSLIQEALKLRDLPPVSDDEEPLNNKS